jgi:small subunit ribosomal protein S24e
MELEIINEKDNPLLGRTEMTFKVIHPDGTPSLNDVRSKLAAIRDLATDSFIVEHVRGEYGRSSSVGDARIYASHDRMMGVESLYVLKRNGFVEEKGEDEDGE